MKKTLLLTLMLGVLALGKLHAQKFLYVDSMYPELSVTVTKNVMYQANISVLTGSPKLDTFRMDVYNPTLNTSGTRPLVIFLHTGSYLPRYMNQTPTGARDDSAVRAFCTQIAQRGYVVAAISYRLGWNPSLSTEDARKASIINAAYKSVQDVAAAVRYFKKSVVISNTYGIDSNRIVIGGQGTGSYAMYAYAGIEKQEDIKIAKFWDFNVNKAMVDDTLWGDRFGFKIPGAPFTLAVENHVGHSSNAAMGFAIAGCMGDSSWIKPGQIPLVSAHPVKDPFGPYKTNMVYVPGTNLAVVEVSGGHTVMSIQNRLSLNTSYTLNSKMWTDPISVKARTMNEGLDGLYPIHGIANGSGPWEWWDDSATLNAKLLAAGMQQAQITTIIKNGQLSNPLMSKSRALRYIDTTLSFIMPRVACALGLWNCQGGQYGIPNSTENPDYSNQVVIAPNPATNSISIWNNMEFNQFNRVVLTDLNGRELSSFSVKGDHITVPLNVKPGIYLLHLNLEKGHAVKKIVVN